MNNIKTAEVFQGQHSGDSETWIVMSSEIVYSPFQTLGERPGA